MAHLTDKVIRASLIDLLKNLPTPPRGILEEVRVHNGNAVADVVAVHRSAHCYEIKGETDAISRLVRQGTYYDQAFQRITLVTTKNHLNHAVRIAPHHWGIIIAEHSGRPHPKLRSFRKSAESPLFDKRVALLTLWKKELLTISPDPIDKADKLSRHSLTELIAEKITDSRVGELIGEMLIDRQIVKAWPIAM